MSKALTGVYCIINKANGKVYIGSTSASFKRRWAGHLHSLRRGKHHSGHLQRAWTKDGEAAFLFEVLFVCSPKECLAWEQRFINMLHAADSGYGYNITPIAGSTTGKICSEATRVKISKALTGKPGRPLSVEHRARLIAFNTGRAQSKESREKISLSRKGRKFQPLSDEQKKKLSIILTGKKRSEETKKRISLAKKGKSLPPFSKQHRSRLSEANKRRIHKPMSKEVRLKMSLAMRGRIFTDEHKKRLSIATKAAWDSGRKTACNQYTRPGRTEKGSQSKRAMVEFRTEPGQISTITPQKVADKGDGLEGGQKERREDRSSRLPWLTFGSAPRSPHHQRDSNQHQEDQDAADDLDGGHGRFSNSSALLIPATSAYWLAPSCL